MPDMDTSENAAPVSDALDGSTLDAVDTPEGPGIGITAPNSTAPNRRLEGNERRLSGKRPAGR